MTKRYWKFYAERDDDDGGTDDEAADEATLRSDAYEKRDGQDD
jgi:hypothetical protein